MRLMTSLDASVYPPPPAEKFESGVEISPDGLEADSYLYVVDRLYAGTMPAVDGLLCCPNGERLTCEVVKRGNKPVAIWRKVGRTKRKPTTGTLGRKSLNRHAKARMRSEMAARVLG